MRFKVRNCSVGKPLPTRPRDNLQRGMEAGIRYSSFLLTCQLNYKSELRAGGSRRQVRKKLKGNLAAASQRRPRRAPKSRAGEHSAAATPLQGEGRQRGVTSKKRL